MFSLVIGCALRCGSAVSFKEMLLWFEVSLSGASLSAEDMSLARQAGLAVDGLIVLTRRFFLLSRAQAS